MGYALIAYQATLKGVSKLEVNADRLLAELDDNWAACRAIQTVMRKYGIEKPYEKLKDLTRGKRVNQTIMAEFIDNLELPDAVKTQMKEMTPANYIGRAGFHRWAKLTLKLRYYAKTKRKVPSFAFFMECAMYQLNINDLTREEFLQHYWQSNHC